MLPQGVFSVAVATVLFPTLSRQAARRDVGGMRRAVGIGMRQINLLLIPSAAVMMVLATPITRLVFQRGAVHRALDPPGLDRAVLVRLQPPVRRGQPAADADLLRRSAAVDPDRARGAQHDRRHRSSASPLQAARDRRAGDRHGGRQHGDDRAPAAPAADRLQRADRGRADADDHRADPRRVGDPGRASRGLCGRGSTSSSGRSLVAQLISVGLSIGSARRSTRGSCSRCESRRRARSRPC